MSDQPDYLTPPGYRDSFAPEEAQGSSGEIAKLRELATHSRPFTRFSDFIADFEPIAYALDGVMRSGSLYTLTARTRTGKTAFNVILALAVVTGEGKRLLGRDVEQGRVLYVALENPDDVRMRFMAACSSITRVKSAAQISSQSPSASKASRCLILST
jgi:AAA domain